MPHKAVIRRQSRVFDNFFKVDEFVVSHEQVDGTMSPDQTRLVFERGDAAAVLLLNLDTKCVVLVEQFKVPALVGRRRDDPSSTDGWILETVAGMVDAGETPEAAAIRETTEETGYKIHQPRLIGQFFSSPGGTSERVFLYFAEVHESDKVEKGGGVGDEDIKVVHLALDALFDRLAAGAIEDPKLLVAAHWLRDQVKSREDRKRLLDAFWDRSTVSVQPAAGTASQPGPRREPLPLSTVRYTIKNKNLFIGYKTGSIDRIRDVGIWVNSENTDMMMDRFLGRSISASIRYLGANKDENENVVEDTIEDALRSAVGQRAHVKIGTVLVTESGSLKTTHNVERIFHVASVEGVGAGRGVKADPEKLVLCIDRLLKRVDEENGRLWNSWLRRPALESILIPMFGAGDGGLPVQEVARRIIPPAIEYLQYTNRPTLKEIYFLAFTMADRIACDELLERFILNGAIVRAGEG
jgi:ADP-ribose pyrophosphatase